MNHWRRGVDKGILKPDGSVEIIRDLLQWAQWMEDSPLSVLALAQDEEYGFFISTVFLGLDHSDGYRPPLWFETMVFRHKTGPSKSCHTQRYSTRAEALAGHANILEKVRSGEIGE